MSHVPRRRTPPLSDHVSTAREKWRGIICAFVRGTMLNRWRVPATKTQEYRVRVLILIFLKSTQSIM